MQDVLLDRDGKVVAAMDMRSRPGKLYCMAKHQAMSVGTGELKETADSIGSWQQVAVYIYEGNVYLYKTHSPRSYDFHQLNEEDTFFVMQHMITGGFVTIT